MTIYAATRRSSRCCAQYDSKIQNKGETEAHNVTGRYTRGNRSTHICEIRMLYGLSDIGLYVENHVTIRHVNV